MKPPSTVWVEFTDDGMPWVCSRAKPRRRGFIKYVLADDDSEAIRALVDAARRVEIKKRPKRKVTRT